MRFCTLQYKRILKYIYPRVIENTIYLIVFRINSILSRKASLKSPVVAITIKTPYMTDRVDAQKGVIIFEVTRNRNNPANIPPIYKQIKLFSNAVIINSFYVHLTQYN